VSSEECGQRRHIHRGKLQQPGCAHGNQQKWILPGPGSASEGDRDTELHRAQGKKGHRLPCPAGHETPDGDGESDCLISTAMRRMRFQSPAPRTLSAGGRGGRRITASSAGSAPSATPVRPWVSRLIHRIWAGNSGSGIPRNGPVNITMISAAPPDMPKSRKRRTFGCGGPRTRRSPWCSTHRGLSAAGRSNQMDPWRCCRARRWCACSRRDRAHSR
jgi:hypothetical protein